MCIINLFVLSLIISLTTSRLVYLTELFRHGARYPVNDYYDGNQTKTMHGELTSVGMRQHYLLGKYLWKDYGDAVGLTSEFNGRQVEVFSAGTRRCVESAYAHMAGWFPLGSGPKIPEGIDPTFLLPPFESTSQLSSEYKLSEYATQQGYQSVPIKTQSPFFPDCPNGPQIFQQRAPIILPFAALLQAEEQSFINRVTKIFNLPIFQHNLVGLLQLFDTVICDANLGRKLPPALTEQDILQMKYIQNYLFALVYDGIVSRVYATPILQAMLFKMDLIVKGKEKEKKLTVFSGHDDNVAPILTFLNLTSANCIQKKFKNQTVEGNCAEPVPFASSLQIQLHVKDTENDQNVADGYYVKVKYNGQYYQLCQSKQKQCSFDDFTKRVRAKLVDFQSECKKK